MFLVSVAVKNVSLVHLKVLWQTIQLRSESVPNNFLRVFIPGGAFFTEYS